PTIKGIVSVAPGEQTDMPPLQVLFEDAGVDGNATPFDDALLLGPGKTAFELHYTVPIFAASHRLRFRYRLQGLDDDWITAGPRRVAYYSHVPPGEYRFRVEAALNGEDRRDGVSELAVDVRPRFYQTLWWRSACAALLVVTAVLGYRLRVRHLVARELKLERLVATRTVQLQEMTRHLTQLTDSNETQETLLVLQEYERHPDGMPAPWRHVLATPTIRDAQGSTTGADAGTAPRLELATMAPHSVLAGRYELQEELGRGGMGIVFKAFDRELEETIAVKLVPLNPSGTSSAILERAKQEIRLARRVTHSNVVRTFEFGGTASRPYIAMEFVHGPPLPHLLTPTGGPP